MNQRAWDNSATADGGPRDERDTRAARLLDDQGLGGSWVAPLSSAQRRLWFLDELHPGNTAYVETIAVALTGQLDVAALRTALGALVARHASLRTKFPVGRTGAVQVVLPEVDWHLHVVDATADELKDQELLLTGVDESGLLAPFDLARAPLFRVQLRTVSETEAILVVVFHHIVWDGACAQILLDELTALYDAQRLRTPDPLPAVTDYVTYARAEKRELSSATAQRSVDYWRQRLAAASPTIWPDHESRPAPIRRTGVVRRRIRDELAHDLRERAKELGCTPFMMGMACAATALRRYISAEEIVLGVPVSVRPAQAKHVIGFFVNTVPLRIALPPQASRREFIESLRDQCLEMITHQQVPFDRIVAAVSPARRLTNPPYLQVLVEYNRFPAPVRTSDGVQWELAWLPGRQAKCDVLIAWNESARGLIVSVEYDTSYVAEEVASEITEGMRDMLSALTLDLDAPLDALPRFPAPVDAARPLRQPAQFTGLSPAEPSGSATAQPDLAGGQTGLTLLRSEALLDTVRNLWREVLGVPEIDDDDDFFELGGHSLLATRLVKGLGTVLNVTIPVQLLFTTESFKEFTQRLETEYYGT